MSSLTFAPPVAPWVGVLVLGAGVAAVLWARRRLPSLGVAKRPARAMVALRVLAVLSLVLAFANPMLVTAAAAGNRPRVRVLLDASSSMTVPDGMRGGTRLDDQRSICREVTRLLGDDFAVDYVAFGADAKAVAKPEDADGKASATNLAAALAAAVKTGEAPPAAVVLVSDGIDTAGATPPAVSVPVFAVPVGTDLARLDDARVTALRVPERVDLHTEASVEVDVAVTGGTAFLGRSKSVPVTLVEGTATVGTQTVSLDAGGKGTARFSPRLDDAGVHVFEARVGPVPGDRAPSDDRRRAFVSAEDPSLRVLFLAARVTQEYKPLKAEIARTPGVRFASAIRVAPGKALTEGVPAGDPLSTGFPSSREALTRFDVVVLGPAPASEVTTAEEDAIVKHVEAGGGLLVLGGEDALGLGGWAGRPLARILPVDLSTGDESLQTGAFKAEPTPEGKASQLLEGITDLLAGGTSGSGLAVQSLHKTGPVKPGASALLQARSPEGPPRPLLVAGSAGKGRVAVLLTNTLHRARTANPEAYAALVRQIVRFLAARDSEREALSLAADKPRHSIGETARIAATVRGPDRAPLPDATIDGRLLALDGKEKGAVSFKPTPDKGPGTFLAEVVVSGDEPVRVRASASGPNGAVGVREVLLRTTSESREGEDLAVDGTRLAAIAAQTGGAVVPPNAVSELPARVAATAPEAPKPVESSLAFDGPWLLLALAAFLTAEWVLRRRQNLT